MTPAPRTRHQRDRRFARVRTLTRSVALGSSVLSLGAIGYLAHLPKAVVHVVHPTTTTTVPPATTTTTSPSTGGGTHPTTTTTVYVPPTTVAVTTTTTCWTTPSGNTTCA